MTDTSREPISSAREGVGHDGAVAREGALRLAFTRRLGARTAATAPR